MAQPERISPGEVRRKQKAGEDVLFVCAYPTEEMFRNAPLEGAISWPEFQRRLPALTKESEILFY